MAWARRLNRGSKALFPSAHLRYDRQLGLDCEGPTLREMIEHGQHCRQLLANAQTLNLLPRIKARIAEDERCFQYGERTLNYYDACVQAFREARAGHRDAARRHYIQAQRLAELLRQDHVSAQGSSSHASAENALLASLAADALQQLARLLDQ